MYLKFNKISNSEYYKIDFTHSYNLFLIKKNIQLHRTKKLCLLSRHIFL